jgi:drug/metabolite transporter (DMT)-like permease
MPIPAARWPVTAALTAAALAAFAANSLLCRLALGGGLIDPAGFTLVRVSTGAAALWLIAAATSRRSSRRGRGSWGSAGALFGYAIAFSFAYVSLATGTGALILFGAVQLTMLLVGLWEGERLGVMGWGGLLLAGGGMVALMVPGLTAPSPVGTALMAVAGVAWGVYSLRGRSVENPIAATAANFMRAVPMVVAVALLALPHLSFQPAGLLWAAVSGALTSGIGYAVWYAALPGLTAARAATVQLLVPVLAAAGGVAVLAERLTPRLLICGAAVLIGVALVVVRRS